MLPRPSAVLGTLALAFATPLVAATAAPPAGPLALDQVLAAPFASELVASPDGRAVAWVVVADGVRNVWCAESPAWTARRVTSYAADDGQEIGELALTGGATPSVVFVRGGGPNRKGEIPNPTSDADGARQEILVVPLAGGAPRRLADGHAPVVTPAGDRVYFVRGGEARVVALGGATPDERLFAARGRVSGLRVSPSGDLVAFVSGRGDHSIVGVFDVASRVVRWLDPSADEDGSPVFTPDGRRVVFVREPGGVVRNPFLAHRQDRPWEIRVADAATGEGRLVFRAAAGRGSVFQELASDSVFTAAADRVVFPWEKDGWLHLYSVPLAGGEPVALTPGAFEVEHASLSPDGRRVVFSSNEADADRRHVWEAPVAGGAPVALTSGGGCEWSPIVVADGSVAALRSEAKRSSRAAIVEKSAIRDLDPAAMPASFAADALVVPQPVEVTAPDGLKLHAQLFLPPEAKDGDRHPAVAFFHGGSRRQMLLGWHPMRYYHQTYAFNQYLASRGYVVLSVNYRSGTGYGLEFREAERFGAGGASEVQDVVAAGRYLRARADVDPARVGLWGGSYGGYLTALGLSRAPELFAAGVDVHGVHDWNVVVRNFVDSWDPLAQPAAGRLAFESSPMSSLGGWKAPVLLVHGDDDRNVPFSETVDLAAALRKQGVETELLVLPDEIHGFLRQSSWKAVFARAASFLERTMPAR